MPMYESKAHEIDLRIGGSAAGRAASSRAPLAALAPRRAPAAAVGVARRGGRRVGEAVVHLDLELARLLQRMGEGGRIERAARLVEDLLEVLLRDGAEVARERVRDTPRGREEVGEGVVVGAQQLAVPRVAQLRLVERARLAVRLERVLVRRELPRREPLDHLLATRGPQRVHDCARPGERLELRVLRRDGGVVGGELVEVIEDLRAQRGADLVDLLAQLVDLADAHVGVEMYEQLVDSLQEIGGLSIHALTRHDVQLLDGGHEHLEALQRGDRLRQVALRVVERLDVAADLVHHLLRRIRLRLDVAHLAALEVGAPRGRLLAHCLQDLLVERLHLLLQLLHVGIHSRQRVLCREQFVDVCGWVEVGLVERVG